MTSSSTPHPSTTNQGQYLRTSLRTIISVSMILSGLCASWVCPFHSMQRDLTLINRHQRERDPSHSRLRAVQPLPASKHKAYILPSALKFRKPQMDSLRIIRDTLRIVWDTLRIIRSLKTPRSSRSTLSYRIMWGPSHAASYISARSSIFGRKVRP
jgi:hypothetical protein